MRTLTRWLAFLLVLAVVAPAYSTSSLIAELKSSDDYRVRVRAALALGMQGGAQARQTLEQALDDQRAAVRTAAAAGLRALKDERSLEALKRHAHDRSPGARAEIEAAVAALQEERTEPTVVVQLGRLSLGKGSKVPSLLTQMREASHQQLSSLPGVVVLGDTDDVMVEAKRRGLPAVLLTGSIKQAGQEQDGAYRAKVEFAVHAMPRKAVVGLMAGSARARASTDGAPAEFLRGEAVTAAVQSALKRAPEAIRAATK
ncbi:HEAT repeat domain-containing protein [Myxococcota bacterium]